MLRRCTRSNVVDKSKFSKLNCSDVQNGVGELQLLRGAFAQTVNKRLFSIFCGLYTDGMHPGNWVIGPYFINGTLNGQRYAAFLQNKLQFVFDEILIIYRTQMW